MALRCAIVILEINNPCVVDLISNADDASGVMVPIPALPDSIRPEPSDTLLPLVPPGGEAAKP